MTPKEKAIELIDKFKEPTKVPNVKGIWIEDLDGAKQCAKITCDEIINDLKSYRVKAYLTTNQAVELYAYWQNVKSEINLIEL